MLNEYLTPDRVMIRSHVDSWREAIDLVGGLLVAHGDVESSYVEAIKTSIAGPGGTYIDLGAGVALAHAPPEAGALRIGLSLLKLDRPIFLADDPHHPITVFIALAARDNASHLEVMRELAELLTDTDRREALLHLAYPEDITPILSTGE